MEFLAVLVGASLALWVCTVGGVAYAIWRFVYMPWKVMRRDMEALKQIAEEAKATAGRAETGRMAQAYSDEELAATEARMMGRSRSRAG